MSPDVAVYLFALLTLAPLAEAKKKKIPKGGGSSLSGGEDSTGEEEELSTGAKIGIAVGAVVALALAVIAYLVWKRKKAAQKLAASGSKNESIIDEEKGAASTPPLVESAQVQPSQAVGHTGKEVEAHDAKYSPPTGPPPSSGADVPPAYNNATSISVSELTKVAS